MDDFTTFFLLLISITILYLYLETKALDVTYVKSNVDNKKYLVRILKDKQEAADLLANIKNKLVKLIEYLDTEKNNKNYSKEYKEGIIRIKKNFNPDKMYESTPNNKYTSYSINKGEKIIFCIREKDITNKLIDINTMMFVAIHEFAHLMSVSIGHTEEFWQNMKFLLIESIKSKIYVYENYRKDPVSYCGTQITDSPYIK
jgi:hypothetical protein